jgi:hypothetical protein
LRTRLLNAKADTRILREMAAMMAMTGVPDVVMAMMGAGMPPCAVMMRPC